MDSCIVATLGTGRDQLVPMAYNYLELVAVERIENHALWSRYARKREGAGPEAHRSSRAA